MPPWSAAEDRFAVKTVADVIGVARSNLIERQVKPGPPAWPLPQGGDAALLLPIGEIVDAWPTCGYRRATTLVNGVPRARGQSTVNAKRVLRIMRRNGLTLAPHTVLRPGRTHDGVVVALRSDVRSRRSANRRCFAGGSSARRG